VLREIEVACTIAAELIGSGDLIHRGDVRGSDGSPLQRRLRWKVLSRTPAPHYSTAASVSALLAGRRFSGAWVRQAMRPVPASVSPDLPLAGVAEQLMSADERALPVVDEAGSLVRVVSADDLQPALTDVGGPDTARDLARPVPEIRAGASLETAAGLLGESEEDGLPVLADEENAVVGCVMQRDVLRAYLRGRPAPSPRRAGVQRQRRQPSRDRTAAS
jgi:CBS domain-containing protein